MHIIDSVHGKGASWVFLHGWSMHRAIWQPLLKTLSPSIRIRAVDLPGFGDSSWHPDYVDFETAVSALEDHLLAHEPGPINLLGWSMGGLYAIALAARGNLNIQRVALIASTPKFAQAPHWPGIQESVLAMFQKQLRRDFAATIERFLAVQAMGSPHIIRDIRLMQELLAQGAEPHPEALVTGLNWLQELDLRTQFEALTCPTLRLYGRRDSLVPMKQASLLNKTIDHVEIFEDSAHTPFLNEPERFCQTLIQFSERSV
ncbi:pimeloyl-ACP methyl ester esterase BioH [Aliidiomarina quisquiliarum]|uniref:pimeloyl-ACP methyl ester esterase BioH n=1 Tax=Aliidiomarina quisquiliarum TaxID=2938947 RepID=UPI00208DE724|nr:pimeloyl-ACP methyl ester esterase BioH [Aliidiomarina quisquiliarum]MCO4322212.1 pimeloyl-ACP methyl ester esterase BioH [Aliidiomarina quisquiliarum]